MARADGGSLATEDGPPSRANHRSTPGPAARRVGPRQKEARVDGRRFDDLTRGLQQRLPRRAALADVLKVGAGSALGLVGLAAVAEPTMAKTCKKKKDCPKGKKCKHKKNGKGHCK
jgi:hypothetical protein